MDHENVETACLPIFIRLSVVFLSSSSSCCWQARELQTIINSWLLCCVLLRGKNKSSNLFTQVGGDTSTLRVSYLLMERLPKLYPFCGFELLLGIFKELMSWPSHNQPKQAQQVDKPTAATPLKLWPQCCVPKQLAIRTPKWLLRVWITKKTPLFQN